MDEIKVIESAKATGERFKCKESAKFVPDIAAQENQLLMVYDDIRYQEIIGFGGMFNEASAYVYSKMDEENRFQILKEYFSSEGLNYSIGRAHIGACDASSGNYSYCDTQGDVSLDTFSTKYDEKYLLPFIEAASKYKGEKIHFLSSTWSPPAWMKTNNDMLYGGSLKREYYGVFAEYLVKYIKDYRSRGVDVDMLSVQNEPKAAQKWESCIYTADEEKEFIRDYLLPCLKRNNIDIKLIIWDHNKERAFERARDVFSDKTVRNAVYGIGFHWYAGDHFENLRLCREFFPEKALLFTEGGVELANDEAMSRKARSGTEGNLIITEGPWEFGECYGHDIMGNLTSGSSGFIDWSMLLDTVGGPNHVNNFCSAPIICDTENQKLFLQSSYYFIGHFSRYIPCRSRLLASSSYTDLFESAAFLTPDGKKVVVIMNKNNDSVPFSLKDVSTNRIADLSVSPKSITTLIYE